MKFRLGINYWPIRSAMAMWKHLDATGVAEDFGQISEAGFDCVRIFLLWEDFQPEPETVSIDRLDDLIPRRPHPSLLHGDLWSGNAHPTVDEEGESIVAVLDPAWVVGELNETNNIVMSAGAIVVNDLGTVGFGDNVGDCSDKSPLRVVLDDSVPLV